MEHPVSQRARFATARSVGGYQRRAVLHLLEPVPLRYLRAHRIVCEGAGAAHGAAEGQAGRGAQRQEGAGTAGPGVRRGPRRGGRPPRRAHPAEGDRPHPASAGEAPGRGQGAAEEPHGGDAAPALRVRHLAHQPGPARPQERVRCLHPALCDAASEVQRGGCHVLCQVHQVHARDAHPRLLLHPVLRQGDQGHGGAGSVQHRRRGQQPGHLPAAHHDPHVPLEGGPEGVRGGVLQQPLLRHQLHPAGG
mmetsp:Transcript_18747/g.56696  ORF Transcript_18747/g.56696 Transcript_18747/m.56696 type:complete len:249 (-) Transcript_18747:2364-3110(-)